MQALETLALKDKLNGILGKLNEQSSPFKLDVHAKYNPLRVTQFNIVPGLLGVVLNMTMVMITALAITRERERGTMENLLAMPTRPLEVLVGKILPYVISGYIQVSLILLFGRLLFDVPIEGSVVLLLLLCFPYIIALLAVGITFSTVASNQLQAMQATMFFFLPSILLSGFAFPFKGMPIWAQTIGNCLPITHFLRIVRGICLKGNGLSECMGSLINLIIFSVVVITIASIRYKQTLD